MTSFYLKRFFLIPLLSVFLGSATIGRAQYTSFVRLETTLGPIDIELYSYAKPNFDRARMGGKALSFGQCYGGRADCLQRGLIQLDKAGPLHEIEHREPR